MNKAALGGVNAGGVDAGVAQNIRQPGQVLFQRVVRPGEQVAQVVGEHLARLHSGALAQPLHIPPDVGAVHGLSRPRHEHRSSGDFLFLKIFFQRPAQLVRQKNRAALALVDDLRPARSCSCR